MIPKPAQPIKRTPLTTPFAAPPDALRTKHTPEPLRRRTLSPIAPLKPTVTRESARRRFSVIASKKPAPPGVKK